MNSSAIQEDLQSVLETVDILIKLLNLLEVIEVTARSESPEELIQVYLTEADCYLNGIRDCLVSVMASMHDLGTAISIGNGNSNN